MKVQITKESIRKYAENYIWWSDVPYFIELEAEMIESDLKGLICNPQECRCGKCKPIEAKS